MMTVWLYAIFAVMILAIIAFVVAMWRRGNIELIHKLYFMVAFITVVWLLSVMQLLFFEGKPTAEYIIDSITNLVLYIPVLMLLIALTLTRGWTRLPRAFLLLLIVPTLAFIAVWTNPLHKLFYSNFAIERDAVAFGPLFYVSSIYFYICVLSASAIMIAFALRNRSRLYIRQALLFCGGMVVSLAGNILAKTIVITPVFYCFGVVLMHGLAIFKLHLLDIKPMAIDTILNRISDCFLVLSDSGVVVNYNQSFNEVFGKTYGITESTHIQDCVASGPDGDDNIGMHTLLTSIESCRRSETTISYEHAINLPTGERGGSKRYYMVDTSPLMSDGKLVGFVVYFKDVTKIRESMQTVQNSRVRMMENERLAFLGQMLGGISHNLKTPIMSISGSTMSVLTLIEESEESLGDPEVTDDDYREIYTEMRQWLSRIQDACAYMSDIITAVKGQATNLNANLTTDFTLDDVVKRTSLLLRHELVGNNCKLIVNNLTEDNSNNIHIHGDINSMVQVINNLVGNAVDAMKPQGGGDIIIEFYREDGQFKILVKDHGPGISEEVKKHLFRQMYTSKGAAGSGMGVYMSNSFIKAKFDGSMWFDDNPGGGAIFGIAIPLEYVSVSSVPVKDAYDADSREASDDTVSDDDTE